MTSRLYQFQRMTSCMCLTKFTKYIRIQIIKTFKYFKSPLSLLVSKVVHCFNTLTVAFHIILHNNPKIAFFNHLLQKFTVHFIFCFAVIVPNVYYFTMYLHWRALASLQTIYIDSGWHGRKMNQCWEAQTQALAVFYFAIPVGRYWPFFVQHCLSLFQTALAWEPKDVHSTTLQLMLLQIAAQISNCYYSPNPVLVDIAVALPFHTLFIGNLIVMVEINSVIQSDICLRIFELQRLKLKTATNIWQMSQTSSKELANRNWLKKDIKIYAIFMITLTIIMMSLCCFIVLDFIRLHPSGHG